MLHPLSLCPTMTVEELLAHLDRGFPFDLALSWDNSGLQVGDAAQQVSAIGVALDPTLEVVVKAKEIGLDCLVTHHPLFFRPLKSVVAHSPVGRIVFELVKHSISLVSLHTNLDVAENGLADYVAKLVDVAVEAPLVLEEGRPLGRVGTTLYSLSFTGFLQKIKAALCGVNLRVVNPPSDDTKRRWKVALCPGSGGDLVGRAVEVGADLYLTGDLKYHQAVDAMQLGLTVVDAGHYGTERPAVVLLAEFLMGAVPQGVPVVKIEVEDPFKEELL